MRGLVFRSPVKFTYWNDDDDEIQEVDASQIWRSSDVVSKMRSALDKDYDRPRLGVGLAKYIGDYDLRRDVKSVTIDFIEVQGKIYTETVCLIDNLDESKLEELKSWITGQFSDGFGESFEQHSIDGIVVDENSSEEVSLYPHIWWMSLGSSEFNLELVQATEF